jgi:excisionase family DNA binding protein
MLRDQLAARAVAGVTEPVAGATPDITGTTALDGLLTKQQVAERFQISQRSVDRLIDGGHLEAVRVGPRLVRVTAESAGRLAQPIHHDGAA